MKAKAIRVVIAREGMDSVVETVPNNLKTFQKLVGGYITCPSLGVYIPLFSGECKGLHLVADDEALLTGKNVNRAFETGNIHGNFFIARADRNTGEYIDLTDADVAFLTHYFQS